jgi:hypothetical protein
MTSPLVPPPARALPAVTALISPVSATQSQPEPFHLSTSPLVQPVELRDMMEPAIEMPGPAEYEVLVPLPQVTLPY